MVLEIVLVSINSSYVQRFARYVRTSRWNDKVRLHLFTSSQDLLAFSAAEKAAFRIALLDEDVYPACAQHQRLHAEHIYRLVKSENLEPGELWMYKPVSQMLQFLYDIYVEQTKLELPQSEIHSGDCKVTAVTSPYGGSGVSTIAFALSRALAMHDAKVLYINMELYPKPHVVPDCKYDFSRLLYVLTTRPDELEQKWQLYCAPHEASSVYCFRPSAVKRDLRDLKSEHVHLLINKFRQFGFSNIVLDTDAHWLDDLIDEHIPHDECWLVVPWNHKDLHDFPEVQALAAQQRTKLIVNQVQAAEYAPLTELEGQVDAVIPHIHGVSERAVKLLIDETIPSQLSRMMSDPLILGGE